MPPKDREPSKAALSSGLTYVAQKPSFLANFGAKPENERGNDLPSRPTDGEWAAGSDEEEEQDEWDAMYGGEEGPQVVVLKEGRHLSADEVARERRRGRLAPGGRLMIAKGEPSPPPETRDGEKTRGDESGEAKGDALDKPSAFKPRPKRKLVGEAVERTKEEEVKDGKPKKKKKAVKTLLSFDEAEGE